MKKLADLLKVGEGSSISDLELLLAKLQTFKKKLQERTANGLDSENLKKIADDMKKSGLVPTFYEYILFFVVLAFMLFVFGENGKNNVFL